jgi:beta-glucanase (GH16 family)
MKRCKSTDLIFIFYVGIILCVLACSKENSEENRDGTAYIVDNEVVSDSSGAIIFKGEYMGNDQYINEKGFIYSNQHNPPTFSDNKVVCSSVFIKDMTSYIEEKGIYYVRAYLICNNKDTIYGKVVKFEYTPVPFEITTNEAVVDSEDMSFRISCSIKGSIPFVKRGFIYSCENAVPSFGKDSLFIVNSYLFEASIVARELYKKYYLRAFTITTSDTIYGNVVEIPPFKPAEYSGMKLIWSDEFNIDGNPDSTKWGAEYGFVRNNELQWYQSKNASCKNGKLIIRGEKERVKNPNYMPGSTDWKKNREYAEYTSASLNTIGRFEFKYGRVEVRAKFPTAAGSWPAIWTLGKWYEWPFNGEVDIFEYYSSYIYANACWGSDKRWIGVWDSARSPISTIKGNDTQWENKFHIWRMDWDEKAINLYLDGTLLNAIDLNSTWNGKPSDLLDGKGINPFRNNPHYLLLNLAIGSNGGTPDDNAFPFLYYVDYVRVYQKD